MDDNNLDDLIKKKLENFEGLDLDASALEDFHRRMASSSNVAWTSKYRREILMGGAGVLFTLLNGFFLWYGFSRSVSLNNDTVNQANVRMVDSLTMVISRLRAEQNERSTFTNTPTDQIGTPVNRLHEVPDKAGINEVATPNDDLTGSNDRLRLGASSSLPADIYERLSRMGVLSEQDGIAYLLITDRVRRIRRMSYDHPSFSYRDVLLDKDSSIDGRNKVEKAFPIELTSRLSLKMINKLQDWKYKRGIGIYIAPHLDLVNGFYPKAMGSIAPRIGVIAEWVVSPHWSFETGIDFMTSRFTLTRDIQSFGLPIQNNNLGEVRSAQISNQTLSAPISIKHRTWLSENRQLVIKAGYTPYFYIRNKYVYKYPLASNSAETELSIDTIEQRDENGFYGGTVSAAVGSSQFSKNRNQVEIYLFYERSLGRVNPGKVSMQLIGVKAAYSIRVR